MIALLTLLSGLLLAVGAWRWSASGIDGASRVALVAVLGVMAAAFNLVVPVPSVEATTTVVLCTALMLGARTGAAAGLVAVVGSSIAGGVGAWTLWQVVAVALVALVGAAVGRVAGRDRDWFTSARRTILGIAAAVSTLTWDVVTTAGGAASYATQPGLTPLEQVMSALLLGLAFTLVHVVFTTAFTVVGGPPLLHALERARPRLGGGEIVPSGHQLAQLGA
jgi:energy-coupling factor transport system substrate-specific component